MGHIGCPPSHVPPGGTEVAHPRTNSPRAQHGPITHTRRPDNNTSLTLTAQSVLWLFDFRRLGLAEDAHATWYAQRKTQQASRQNKIRLCHLLQAVPLSLSRTHPYFHSHQRTQSTVCPPPMTSGSPTRREYRGRKLNLFRGTCVREAFAAIIRDYHSRPSTTYA